MSENNEKARHGFVSFWLWANILGNSFLTVQQFATRNDSSDLNSKGIMFSIAVIVGNILILKWKIIGVFVIYAVAVLVAVITAPFLFYFGYGLITPIGLALIISIHATIFNIKENGISVWEHLKNEAKANKREARIWVARVFGTIILLFVIAAFPIKIFYGNIIVLFAPQRIVPYYGYSGKVLGNHVLKTEYGEIRIGHLSFVSINGIGDMGIKSELFENGQVSHNLVFLGTELPEHLYVRFNRSQITEFDLNRDISIYGIPITGNIFFFDPPNNTVLLGEGVMGLIRRRRYGFNTPQLAAVLTSGV